MLKMDSLTHNYQANTAVCWAAAFIAAFSNWKTQDIESIRGAVVKAVPPTINRTEQNSTCVQGGSVSCAGTHQAVRVIAP